MPEGDTVWRTAQRLDQALGGRTLLTGQLRLPQYAEVDLTGKKVVETVSRGKHLLTRFDDLTLHTHLRMEGSWHIYRVGAAWRSPGFQARVVLANDDWQAVGFLLGVVDLVARDDEDSVVGHLGPDLLGADWSAVKALQLLGLRPARPVGEALLDQRNLAGIGNLYKAEACFLLGVHPQTPVGQVDVLPQLVDKARQLLGANKDRAEQTTTGNIRRGQQTWVFRRAGQPCRRCGTPIAEDTFATSEDQTHGVTPPGARQDSSALTRSARQQSAVGRPSQARVSFWCPSCQPAQT